MRFRGPASRLTADNRLLAVAAESVIRLVALDGPAAGTVVGREGFEQPVLGLQLDGDDLYVAVSHDGLVRLDVSDPAAPVISGRLVTRGQAVGVAAGGSHVYVADNALGFDVVGTGDELTRDGEYLADGFPRGIAASEGLVLVADQPAGLIVVDVATPPAPAVVGILSLGADPVQAVVTPGGAPRERATFAGLLSQMAGLQVVDLSDPSRPVVTSTIETTEPARGVAAWQRTVYVAAGDAVTAWEVSDLARPRRVATREIGMPVGPLAVTRTSLFVGTPDGVLVFARE